jgi:GNAT superfamily N-acetyltransferase
MPGIIRPYKSSDCLAVRKIYGMDEFARPRLLIKYPRYGEYLADEMSYYQDFESESLFIAEQNGHVVGALLGTVDTKRFELIYQRKIRWRFFWRGLLGAYGWPGWLPSVLRTEWKNRDIHAPIVDRIKFPAHLHIGVLPEYRRQGLGTALMERFADYLRARNVSGYHLFASSFHPLGVAFYQKLGLTLLGQFEWRLHDGFGWVYVTEKIFAKQV